MSKAKLAARGLAAVQVSAEWSVELSGFRDTQDGTPNTHYYINIMYTIDTIQYNTMAKHATRRSYKNRASKKRRTIRKLKRTLRRKIQRGGGPQEDAALFNAVFPIVQRLIPGIFTLVMKNLGPLLQIFMLLGKAGAIRGGSKTRLTQRGGGFSQAVKDQLISKLTMLKTNFQGRDDLIKCIDILISKFQTAPVDPTAVAPPPEAAAETIDLSVVQAELNEAPAPTSDVPAPVSESLVDRFIQKFKDNVIGTLNSKIEKLRGFFNEQELDCLITLKNAILEDFKLKINTKVEVIKQNPTVMSAIDKIDLIKGVAGAVGTAVTSKVADLKGAVQDRFNSFKGKFGFGRS